MNKFFTFLIMAFAALTAQATDYTDKLVVKVNGMGAEQQATISVTEDGDLYNLNLKNFILMSGDQPMAVGNVEVKGIAPEQSGDAIFLRASQDINVTAGDAEGVNFWMGPMLGQLPVNLTAVIEGDKMHALITLDLMSSLEQMIEVHFGSGLHIPNGGFEDWHTSSGSYVEPNAWHSFESGTGWLAGSAGNHISKSEDGRNGTSCARIFSTSKFFGTIIANGTMTTGRMNAGNMSASHTDNHAYMDISSEDVDGNGDPFYVSLTSRPDSLVLWMQFKQGKTNAAHPYATVSAIITDGTRYQDPEDKTYTNVVAKAKNNTIAVTNGQWKRISIPFEYTTNNVEPKAILITISTNADAGQGSDGDEVLVDDLTLVYNGGVTSLSVVDGFAPDKFEYELNEEVDLDDFEVETDAKAPYVLKSLKEDENGKSAVITVISADLLTSSTYTVNFKVSTGIDEVNPSETTSANAYYNLSGMKVATPRQGQIYIVKQADGRIVKVCQ
ncbi:MAG: PCMD domain-containing protein [Prevotella sp.]|nr:PCMD domain-containing protein [Prevotella sp.]